MNPSINDRFKFWKTYPKINAPFKRHLADGTTKGKLGKFIIGDWAQSEFAYLCHNQWLWHEKVDGTNVRIIVVRHEDGSVSGKVGGKTDNAQLHTELLERLNTHADRIARWAMETWDSPGEMIFYGEGYGPKIQSGGTYRDDIDVIFFDIRANGWWLEKSAVEEICGSIGLPVVPFFAEWSLINVMELFTKPVGSLISPKATMEGVVGTPSIPLYTRKGERILTKVKTVDLRDATFESVEDAECPT